MKFRTLVVFLCLLLMASLCWADDAAPTPPNNMQLFLLIGQSNMAGRGKVGPEDLVTNPHIFMLTKDLQWVLAKDPVHFDKPQIAGVGLASQFARTLAKADPNITIGLIPCAFGGTSLDEWKVGDKLYNDAVARTREAQKHGTLAGILWHQGEADISSAKVATYADRFSTMIAQLRKDVGGENVPVVIGELGRFYHPDMPKFNANLPEVARRVPLCDVVSSEGLTDIGDHTHFNTPSLYTFGERYATVYLKLKAQAEKSK